MAPGEATPPRVDHMLSPQNIDHGSPADSHDADMDLPAMPEPAQLEVLSEPTQPPSTTTAPQAPQPPTTTETADYSTVGHGPSNEPTSTYYNNANDAYFIYLTRDRQQLNSHRRPEHYADRLPHRNGRSTWPSLMFHSSGATRNRCDHHVFMVNNGTTSVSHMKSTSRMKICRSLQKKMSRLKKFKNISRSSLLILRDKLRYASHSLALKIDASFKKRRTRN